MDSKFLVNFKLVTEQLQKLEDKLIQKNKLIQTTNDINKANAKEGVTPILQPKINISNELQAAKPQWFVNAESNLKNININDELILINEKKSKLSRRMRDLVILKSKTI